jgi:hypothetical protein
MDFVSEIAYNPLPSGKVVRVITLEYLKALII